MNPRLKKLIAFVVVISTILIVGGVVYTSLLGVENSQYTKTTATIVDFDVVSVGEKNGIEQFEIKNVRVTYETPDGTKINTLSGVVMKRSYYIDEQVEVRFNNANPDIVKIEMIDWFPAVFLLILGVLYAVGGAVVVVLRKQAGYYAIVEQNNEPCPLEDDDFSIADQIEKMEQAALGQVDDTVQSQKE
jgi:hypothetical protein